MALDIWGHLFKPKDMKNLLLALIVVCLSSCSGCNPQKQLAAAKERFPGLKLYGTYEERDRMVGIDTLGNVYMITLGELNAKVHDVEVLVRLDTLQNTRTIK